jgi:microfibrillar-associated protein 1
MLVKPVFKPRSQRETLKEREALEQEEEEAEERRKERLKEKKVESKSLLVEQIKLAEEADKAADMNDSSDIELIDDNDEINEAEEYDLWKIRELKRIKRDKEERLERQKEMEFVMKRRAMTDAEREEDDRRMDLKANKRDEVKQFNFLQKYYHRGGFFQDKAVKGEEPLYLRDYHEPLEEEKFDKTLLPKAMQLRRGQFGKKGQVKHSHLTEVDTTDRSAAWAQHSKQVQRYQERMATASGVDAFDRPSGKAA